MTTDAPIYPASYLASALKLEGASHHPVMGVFIGRFQPFHAGHLHVVERALEQVDHLLILVGSANVPRGIVHTFTVDERTAMILASLSPDQATRVSIVGLEDSNDSNAQWVESVKAQAAIACTRLYGDLPARVSLVGHNKDHSSYYLRLFPEWTSLDVYAVPGADCDVLSATPLRQQLLGSPSFWRAFLDETPDIKRAAFLDLAVERARPAALAWLETAPSGVIPATVPLLRAFVESDQFEGPCKEAAYAAHFRYAWRHSPYAPLFVTADPVVFHGDHVLMIRRADYPGRGQWALPGGFVEEDEPIFAGCLRELAEETALGLTEAELEPLCFFHKTYDDPRRSVRGRVITHAFGFKLDARKPRPTASINAESLGLSWIHINDLRRDQSFEDHYAVVHRFHATMREKDNQP